VVLEVHLMSWDYLKYLFSGFGLKMQSHRWIHTHFGICLPYHQVKAVGSIIYAAIFWKIVKGFL
jgi:hypothetical protein